MSAPKYIESKRTEITLTVGQYGNANTIQKYIQEQGKEKEYPKIYQQQLMFF